MNEKQIIKALSKVNDPDLKKDLVSLNMIKNISIDNNVVSFEIVLTTPACPLKEQIKKDCLNELNKINNNLKYNITFSSNVVPFDKKTMIKNIKNIIAISSGKGGVGKSTIASNLAVGLSIMGAKTGLIDADIFGPSIPTMFNCENEQPTIKKTKEKNIIIPIEQYGIKLLSMGLLIPNNKAVVWRGPMASSAMKQLILDVEWGELDYLIVDLPPGTSDIHITLSQSFPVTGTVIITTPQKVSTNDAEKAISMYNQEQTNIPIIGLIENMSYFIDDNNKKNYLFGKDGGKTLCNKFSIDFIGQIPIDKRISDGSDLGYPIILKENKISNIFKTLSQNIARKIAINNSK
ncbi:MAG TPA: iron-sulfur cluster carrier protein ApbC [Cytophagales bacterium]|jgi:ATP-binding protein involved in chromosome partitioning|nr:iron-sulfur cluster carrier protein ApbC [Cytophagales bacterium]